MEVLDLSFFVSDFILGAILAFLCLRHQTLGHNRKRDLFVSYKKNRRNLYL